MAATVELTVGLLVESTEDWPAAATGELRGTAAADSMAGAGAEKGVAAGPALPLRATW